MQLNDNSLFQLKVQIVCVTRISLGFVFEFSFVFFIAISFDKFIAAMAGRLKLLQFTQKAYRHIGIYPSQSNRNWHSINWRSIFMLFSLIQMAVSSLAFLLFEANDIVDAGLSFFAVNSEICCTTYYLINMWKIPKILELIERFDKFIENSELI